MLLFDFKSKQIQEYTNKTQSNNFQCFRSKKMAIEDRMSMKWQCRLEKSMANIKKKVKKTKEIA